MVKLKSFKSIEPIELAEGHQGNRLAGSRDNSVDQADRDQTSGSIASSSSTKSATSIRSGGNLTLETRSEVSLKLNEGPPHQVGSSATGVHSTSSASSTLSLNEEFQSARIVVNEDEEEEEEDEAVSKIEIEHVGDSSASPKEAPQPQQPPPPPVPIAKVSKSAQNSPLVTSTMRLQQQRLANQQQRQANSNSPLNTPGLVRSAKLSNMQRSQTSPSPLSQMVGKLARAAGGGGGKLSSQLNSHDSASQFSLQYKYQGSNHFEIRWQNLRLFARPKSRLPQFVSDSKVYKFVFGSAQGLDQHLEAAGGELASKPPLSPLMHKIPPTIDENLEMKCTNKTLEGAGVGLNGGNIPNTTPLNSPLPFQQAHQHQQPPLTPSSDIQTTSASATRCILNNISGQVFSGQMTAILGPSGVGKTSLLNSLTGRNTLDGTGRVSLIGANQSRRMGVVTVPQVDVLPNKLTVNEDLQFTSRLKNPQAKFDHQRNIDRLVKHLHMDKFLHTRIQKLSGGEARRLSIARELLSSPDILILDEPTSGLDANTCKKIITALRDIVEHSDNILDKPMSIIITIHQPQQEVYQLFHRVYVMATGGRVIYEGSPQLLMPTMLEFSSVSRIAGEMQLQLNENPAIVAIEVASGEFGGQVIDELAQHHESQVCEEFLGIGFGSPLTAGSGHGNNFESPMLTPRSLRLHRSPNSVSRFDVQLHRKRLNSLGEVSLGRATPVMSKRQLSAGQQQAPPTPQWDRVSQITSISYASTYDADLPEQTSRLKVDKRLRRSVVMKSHFISHTLTLIKRCWLLTIRDLFLMAIRVLGFLLVAGGTVQIFSHALDPNENQCPQFVTEVDDMPDYLQQVKLRLMGLFEMLRQANSTHLYFFHLLLCITMVTSALAGLMFPLQMRMFIREYKNGWYSPASFITSQTIAELPVDVIGPLITLLIAYPLCHQPDSLYHWRLIGYCLIMILASIICKSQAQIVGAFLMDSVENSVFISCVAVTPPALLSGVPLRIDQMIAPLRLISYGSFLRYAFESLLELRYGYDMCPCDPNLVDGPLRASLQAVPPHLENLATGLLELSLTTTTGPNGTVSSVTIGPDGGELTATALAANTIGQTEHENVFIKFLRLVTNAGNMFTTESEYTNCDRYRSLYLINMGIENNTLVRWLIVMIFMFVASRFITYFAVRTVIRLRRT